MKAIRLFSVFIFLSSTCLLPAQQPELDSATVAEQVSFFTLDNNTAEGNGIDLLLRQTQEAQFVLLGEYHGSQKLSEFTRFLLPHLKKSGFRHFGLEVGPTSARILQRLSEQPANARQALHDLNSRYLTPEEDPFTPIPFFSHQEDAGFLAQASREDMQLWGLDQEFCYGLTLLLNEMASRAKAAGLFEGIKKKWTNAYHFVETQIDKEVNEDRYPMFRKLTENDELQQTLDYFAGRDKVLEKMVSDFRKTVAIYLDNEESRYYQNNKRRAQHMKDNFMYAYQEALRKEASPRFFIKMGGMHTGRGMNPLEVYDIGNTISELAAMNNGRSLHIDCMLRYYREDGQIKDRLDNPNQWVQRYKVFLQQGKKDRWTLIDLRPLINKVFYFKGMKTSEAVKDLIKSHDFILIPPVDQEPTPNFTKN